MERKRVDLSWYEKHDITENELGYIEQLLDIDRTLVECDTILAEVGLQTGYSSLADEILEIMEKRQHLWQFVLALPEHIQFHLDEPLRQALNHGACETISRIHAEDFQVENTLGVTVEAAARGYSAAVAKDRLTLKDFLGNAVGETAGSVIPNLSGRTNGCVEEFASIFSRQYENLLSEGMLDTDCRDLEDYLEGLARMGEYDHKEDHPFYEMLASSLLDLTIVKPLIEIGCGYDLITGEDLTELERGMKLVGAAVDLITLATGLYGFSVAAKNMGKKEVLRYFAQMALCELAADVSATTVATIGEYNDWPAGLTLLLSLGTGLTVGRIGNELIFKRNGIEILRKEVPEGGTDLKELPGSSLGDGMLPEDGQVCRQGGNVTGSNLEEAKGLQGVGNSLIEGGSSTLNDWVNRIPELEKQAPIEIPSNATVKVQAKNGYDQISFKWTENGQNYEVRWHTKTPGAPEGQGNTWVVSRVTSGTPTGQVRTEHILL